MFFIESIIHKLESFGGFCSVLVFFVGGAFLRNKQLFQGEQEYRDSIFFQEIHLKESERERLCLETEK